MKIEIDKEKVWRYMNISDSIAVACAVLGVLFFWDDVVSIIAIWFLTFLWSGLGLRRYCKYDKMMRFGVHSDVKEGDNREVMSSYHHHIVIMVLSNVLIVSASAYHLYQFLTS